MIELRNITRIFRTDTVETTALDRIDLSIGPGEFIAVRGPSGCGKSTLLNLLGLMDTPTSGEYRFLDRETARMSESQRTLLRKGSIGFVFQKFNLIDSLTIFENVELPLLYLRKPADQRRKIVQDVLERLQMAHRTKHFPHQLSGGQQQRAAVARAIAVNPALILADEPTGNLDSANGAQVMELLGELHREGKTVIMVTHDEHYASFAGRTIRLLDGRLEADPPGQ